MGRRAAVEVLPEVEINGDDANGDATDSRPALTSAQRLAASASSEVAPDTFGREAKHFTEIRVLNREVCTFPLVPQNGSSRWLLLICV